MSTDSRVTQVTREDSEITALLERIEKKLDLLLAQKERETRAKVSS